MAQIPDVTALGGRNEPSRLLPIVREDRTQVSRALQQAGSVIGEEAEKHLREQQKKADVTEFETIRNATNQWEQENVWDPEKGYATTKQQDAFGVRDKVAGGFKAFRTNIEKTVKSPRAKAMVTEFLNSRDAQLQEWGAKHEFGERNAYADTTHAASVDSATQRASTLASQTATMPDGRIVFPGVARELEFIRAAETEFAGRKGVRDPAIVKEAVRQKQSAVHSGVLDALIAKRDYKKAQLYFDQYGKDMGDRERALAMKTIQEGADFLEVDAVVGDIVDRDGARASRNSPEAVERADQVVTPPEQATPTLPAKPNPVRDVIRQEAEAAGEDPNRAAVISHMESRLKPDARPIDRKTGKPLSSAYGLYQNTDANWAQYGKGDRNDPREQARAGMRYMQDVRKAVGPDADNGSFYFSYVLGPGAAGALKGNQKLGVRQALIQTGKYSPKAATAAVKNNGLAGLSVEQAVRKFSDRYAKAERELGVPAPEPIMLAAADTGTMTDVAPSPIAAPAAPASAPTTTPARAVTDVPPPQPRRGIADMAAEVRERYKDDPWKQQKAMQQLEQRLQIDAKQRLENDRAGLAYGYELMEANSGQFDLLTPDQKKQIGADNWPTVRAYGKQVASGREAEMDWKSWVAIDKPDVIANATDAQMEIWYRAFPKEYSDKLRSTRQKFLNDPSEVESAKMDSNDFNLLAVQAGLEPFDDKDADSKQAIAELRFEVDNRLAEAQKASGGKKLDRQAKLSVMQKVIDDKVMLDTWGSDESVPRYQVKGEDEEDAYVVVDDVEVKLSDIPDTSRTKIQNALESKGLPVTEQNIARYWLRGKKR